MSRNSKLAQALRKNRERAGSQFLPFYKFPNGKTIIRILPSAKEDGDDDWFLPLGLHYNILEKRPLVCLYETMWAEDECPVCEFVKELRRDGMNDEAGKIALRRRFVVRAIVRGEEDKGAQILNLPSTLFDAIGEIVSDEETFGDVIHPGPKGRDIIVNKSGTGLGTEYQANAHPKNIPALPTAEAVKEVLAGFQSITTLVDIPDATDLEDALKTKFGFSSAMGNVYQEDDDDDDDSYGFDSDDDDDDDIDDTPTDEHPTVEDDAWLGDVLDDDDDDDTPSVSQMAKEDQEGTKVSGLADDIGEATGGKAKKRATKSRSKKK